MHRCDKIQTTTSVIVADELVQECCPSTIYMRIQGGRTTKLFFFLSANNLRFWKASSGCRCFLQHDVVYTTSISSEFVFNGKATRAWRGSCTIGRRRIAFYIHTVIPKVERSVIYYWPCSRALAGQSEFVVPAITVFSLIDNLMPSHLQFVH